MKIGHVTWNQTLIDMLMTSYILNNLVGKSAPDPLTKTTTTDSAGPGPRPSTAPPTSSYSAPPASPGFRPNTAPPTSSNDVPPISRTGRSDPKHSMSNVEGNDPTAPVDKPDAFKS